MLTNQLLSENDGNDLTATTINDDGSFSEIHSSEQIEFRHSIYDWCLRKAQHYLERNLLEEGLRWDLLAGYIAHFDCSPLSSPLLESHLVKVASRLSMPELIRQPTGQKPCRWLHVLNVAFPVGGHTAMAVRWITLDQDHNKHSVVLLDQRDEVPTSLQDAAEKTGGVVEVLDPDASIISRAEWLRKYVWQEADVVVLHITSFDVISTVAFGIPGGPPILLVNHAAHIFWIGCSVADLVLNCRGSALEHDWTVRYRGIDPQRSLTLPIPLPSPKSIYEKDDLPDVRQKAKADLSLPPEALVILTVGSTFKYIPMPGIDFLDAALQILQKNADFYLIAVGVDENESWKAIRDKCGGRLRAVGRQLDLSQYHAAADVYIEGFPFGSTTAMLEAGLRGIPCVLAPATCPPPFTSDGVAFEVLDRPTDLDDYVRAITALLEDSCERTRIGSSLAASIAAHHGDVGWVGYLDVIKQKLLVNHRIYTLRSAPSVPAKIVNYWSGFSSLVKYDPLVVVILEAIKLGLKPDLDRQLRRAMLTASSFRKNYELIDMLAALTGPVSSFLPFVTSSDFYASLFDYLRPEGKIMRLRSKIMSTSSAGGNLRRAIRVVKSVSG